MRNQKPITLTESRLRQIIKEELHAAADAVLLADLYRPGSPEVKVTRRGMEADTRTMQKLENFCRDYHDLCGSFGTAAIEAALQLTLGFITAQSLLEDMDLESGEFDHVVGAGEAGVKNWADSIISNLAEYTGTGDLLVLGAPSRIKSIGSDMGPFDRGHVSIRDIAKGRV